MGVIHVPVPSMSGWHIEARGRSFHLAGPGGNEFNAPEHLPFARVFSGWWVAQHHLHAVCAALELVDHILDLGWRATIRERDDERPGSGSGAVRPIKIKTGSGPNRIGTGMIFTGLPEHGWPCDHLRSLEFNYAELPLLLGWVLGLHADNCLCTMPPEGPIIPEYEMLAWRAETAAASAEMLEAANALSHKGERIYAELSQAIADGAYAPGECLPMQGQMLKTYRTSTAVVTKVLRRLEADGLIERAHSRARPRVRAQRREAAPVM
jgi:DNA-binding MarR family transcriptional regulator